MVYPQRFSRASIRDVEGNVRSSISFVHGLLDPIKLAGEHGSLIFQTFLRRDLQSVSRHITANDVLEGFLDEPRWLDGEFVRIQTSVNEPVKDDPFGRVEMEEFLNSGAEQVGPGAFWRKITPIVVIAARRNNPNILHATHYQVCPHAKICHEGHTRFAGKIEDPGEEHSPGTGRQSPQLCWVECVAVRRKSLKKHNANPKVFVPLKVFIWIDKRPVLGRGRDNTFEWRIEEGPVKIAAEKLYRFAVVRKVSYFSRVLPVEERRRAAVARIRSPHRKA